MPLPLRSRVTALQRVLAEEARKRLKLTDTYRVTVTIDVRLQNGKRRVRILPDKPVTRADVQEVLRVLSASPSYAVRHYVILLADSGSVMFPPARWQVPKAMNAMLVKSGHKYRIKSPGTHNQKFNERVYKIYHCEDA